MGCLPIYLSRFPTNDTAAYDQFHCLKDWNSISDCHNYHLRNTIEELKKEYPDVTIVYADYYSVFEWLLTHQEELGKSPNQTYTLLLLRKLLEML